MNGELSLAGLVPRPCELSRRNVGLSSTSSSPMSISYVLVDVVVVVVVARSDMDLCLERPRRGLPPPPPLSSESRLVALSWNGMFPLVTSYSVMPCRGGGLASDSPRGSASSSTDAAGRRRLRLTGVFGAEYVWSSMPPALVLRLISASRLLRLSAARAWAISRCLVSGLFGEWVVGEYM